MRVFIGAVQTLAQSTQMTENCWPSDILRGMSELRGLSSLRQYMIVLNTGQK